MTHPAASPSWVPVSPCTPEVCLRDPAHAAGIARRVMRCVACVAVVVAGVALSSAVACMRPPVRHALVRAWARAVLRTLGVRVRVLKYEATARPATPGGVPPSTAALIPAPTSSPAPTAHPVRGELLVANHISWLDIALLAIVRPARMVAKREVGEWPVLGRFVARGGTVFVARDRPRSLPGDVAAIAAALRTGSWVGVFPEGSTWCGARQGPFRRAVFQAALDAGAAVRPVVLRYLGPDGGPAREAAFVGEDTLAASLWRVAGVCGIVAEARVLRAIPPGEYPDRRTLAAAAQGMVVQAGRPEDGPEPVGTRERVAPRARRATTYRAAPVHQLGAARGVPSGRWQPSAEGG
ncbi:lysophospholipid acyltransferase family protein [Streptodolium elevatio]